MRAAHEMEPLIRDWLHDTLDAVPEPAHRYARIATEIQTTPQQPDPSTWTGTRMVPSVSWVVKSIAAVVVVAVIGSVAYLNLEAVQSPTDRSATAPIELDQLAASTAVVDPSALDASIPTHRYQSTGFPAAGPLEAGRHEIIRDSKPSSFAVSTAGWSSDGVSVITRAADGAGVRFWPASPGGVHTGGCAGGPVRAVAGPLIDPAATMATIPGAIGPAEAVVAGRIAAHVVLTVPDGSVCGAGGFRLWDDEAPDGRPEPQPGDIIGTWIVEWDDDAMLWIEARTPNGAGPGVDPEIAQVIASMTAPGFPIFPPAGPLDEVRPAFHRGHEPGEFEFPTNWPPGFPTGYLDFSVPTTYRWHSSGFDDVGNGGGSIVRGEPGTPDGAVITFSRPDHVYADPCAQTLLDPPPGPSVDNLASALASIPGTDLLSGPTDARVEGAGVAKELVLRVREDIACDPEQFYLWADECVTTDLPSYDLLERVCLERPEPRPARAPGSTIRLWIISKDETGLHGAAERILIDAETYAGARPEVEEEVQRIIDSVVIPSYGSG